MSGRITKRKIEEHADEDLQEAKQSKTDEAQPQISSSRSGRARKKSAKVLEMEAFEEEVASSITKGRKKQVKVQEIVEDVTVTSLPINVKKSPKTSPASARKKGKLTSNIDTTADVGSLEIKEEPVPEIKEASSLKLMLTLPTKLESDIIYPEGSTALHSAVLHSAADADADDTVKVEEETSKTKTKKKSSKKSKAKTVKEEVLPDITMNTNQSPPKLENPQVKEELSTPFGGLGAMDDLADDNPLVVAEKSTKKKKPPSKKKIKKPETTAFQPALLNFDPESSQKMEMLDYSEFVDTVTGMKEEVADVNVETNKSPNTKKKSIPKKKSPIKSAKKKQPAASVEKNKSKKKTTALNPDKTPKRRTTAYTLWCNNMRKQLMVQYPDSDFAHISRKLAELWQTVSVAEKDTLRRRAKKIQKKQDMGKAVPVNTLPVSTHMRSGQSQQIERSKPIVYTNQQSPPHLPSFKITGNAPIDVAAHLKLLGESLGTIGARLQEHRGQIAVQGSLSVLLDSMLCALGPLMCLTNQVPELNSVPTHIHKRTLDNIAYIMPGIG